MNLYSFYDQELNSYISDPDEDPKVYEVYILAHNDVEARRYLADQRGEKWLDPQRCVISECWDEMNCPDQVLVQVQRYDEHKQYLFEIRGNGENDNGAYRYRVFSISLENAKKHAENFGDKKFGNRNGCTIEFIRETAIVEGEETAVYDEWY